MKKVIVMDGKEVGVACSAYTPRLYRNKFNRDLIKDFNKIGEALKKGQKLSNAEKLELIDLEVLENIAYIMAKEYDLQGVPDDPMEWLMQFENFSIYKALPDIISLWYQNQVTTSTPTKK